MSGLPAPAFDTGFGGLQIEFYPKSQTMEEAVEKTTKSSKERIVDLISENPDIAISEISKSIGISIKGVEKQISVLRKSGIIERIGSDKTGRWRIITQK